MLNKLLYLLLFLNIHLLYADLSVKILNPSFESGWVKWGKSKKETAISDIAYHGKHSAKITDKKGKFHQSIRVKKHTNYQLRAWVLGKGILGVRAGKKVYKITTDTNHWKNQTVVFNSEDNDKIEIFGKYISDAVRFDYFSLVQVVSPENYITYSKHSEFTAKKSNSKKQKKYPSDIIPAITQKWKLTLPIDKYGNDNSMALSYKKRDTNPPLEIKDKNLKYYEYPPYFYVKNKEVFFRAYASGVTTKNSHYPRCELRQNVDGNYGMWSLQDEQYLYVELRITHVPTIKPEVTIVQIHGKNDETLRINYNQNRGIYIYRDEKNGLSEGDKPLEYSLGEKLQITVNVKKGVVQCLIKNVSRATEFQSTWKSKEPVGYFKVGCYTQSSIFLPYFKTDKNGNPLYSQGEPSNAYAEVAVAKIILKEAF